MHDKKRRLRRPERSANAEEVRVVVYWGNDERPEPEAGEAVIQLTWSDSIKPNMSRLTEQRNAHSVRSVGR